MALGSPRVGGFGTNVAVGRAGRVAPPPPTEAERKAATKPRSPNPITRAWWWVGDQLDKWGDDVAGGMRPKPPAPGQPYRPPIGAPGAPSPAGTSGSSGGWGGGATPPIPRQSGQSYIDAYNNRRQNAAASALNQGMRASADATRWSTESDLNFQQAQIAAANAAAMGDYERANQLRGIAEQYASGAYAVGKAGVDVTGKALDRQVGYQGDMRRIDQWTNIGEIAGTDIDSRANERQFGLINAARGDLGANLAREKARLTDVEAGISQNEQTVKRQERQAQYKAFSDAAASGNVSQISRMNAKELKSSLTDNLADFQRERNQAGRQRGQAEQDYQTQMRDLQEQEASAVDARKKLKLRRQIQLLNEQRQQRQYQEELAQIEDRKKENFLNLMTIELERRKGIGERDVDRQKAEADRLNAFYTAVAGQQNITQQRLAAAAQQNATKQMYPAPNTLLPPTYRRGRGPAR